MAQTLSPRRNYIQNRINALGITPRAYELNRMIEIILSFHPSDDEIETKLSLIKIKIEKGSVKSLPGYTHKVFCGPSKPQL